jgi:hypothetical protein
LPTAGHTHGGQAGHSQTGKGVGLYGLSHSTTSEEALPAATGVERQSPATL